MTKISANEGKWMMLSLLLPKLFFTPIYRLVSRSGTGAYIEAIYISVLALILFSIIALLYKNFSGVSIYSLAEFSLGKGGMNIFGFIIFIFAILNVSIFLRIFSSIISFLTLKGASLFYITAFIAVTMFVSARKGINGLSKISVLWGGMILAIIISILLLSIDEMNINNIFPVLGNGASKIISGYMDLPIFFEIVYFIFIFPHLKADYKKSGYKSIIWFSIILIIFTLIYTLLVPYPSSVKFKLPLLQITSSVNLDILFQRIDALYLIAIIFSSFMYLGMVFGISGSIAKHTFGINDKKAIIGALTIITVTLSLLISNTNTAFKLYEIFSKAFFIYGYLAIVLVLTIANIKHKYFKKEVKT